jgi:hypothetical protein
MPLTPPMKPLIISASATFFWLSKNCFSRLLKACRRHAFS